MRSPLILCGAAVLAIYGAPAIAQDATSTSAPTAPIPPQSPMATPNSMNATGPTACATALDVKTCNDAAAAQVTASTEAQTTTMSPSTAPAPTTRLYTSTTPNVTNTLVSSGPVPDTAENRAKYGGPKSRAGKRTAPTGN